MQWAKASITWYLATLAVIRGHLRNAILCTEESMCVKERKIAVLDCNSGCYDEGTEVRSVPIKIIEQQRREVMKWYNVLCTVVGFKS
jgi:hypothetical protein